MRDGEWEFKVSRDLSLSINLVASDAAYHKQCIQDVLYQALKVVQLHQVDQCIKVNKMRF